LNVGTVEVIEGATSLVVVYEITDLNWSITQLHLEVSNEPIDVWAPGQYDYVMEDLNTQYIEIPIPYYSGDCVYVAAHAVVTVVDELEVSLPDFELNLPDQVSMSLTYPYEGGPSYFQTTVSNGVLGGTYDGWCVDTDNVIYQNTDYTADVYSSYESLPAGIIEYPENLDLVNWILNQNFVGSPSPGGYGNYTYGDVQKAIWLLVDDTESNSGLGSWNLNRVNEILAAANAYGEGFVPGCNGVIAVILVPEDPETQVIIAQVTAIGTSALQKRSRVKGLSPLGRSISTKSASIF